MTTEIEHLLAWCNMVSARIEYLGEGGVLVTAWVHEGLVHLEAGGESTTLRGAIVECQRDFAKLKAGALA